MWGFIVFIIAAILIFSISKLISYRHRSNRYDHSSTFIPFSSSTDSKPDQDLHHHPNHKHHHHPHHHGDMPNHLHHHNAHGTGHHGGHHDSGGFGGGFDGGGGGHH